MGVINRTKGVLQSAMSDEVVRSVDSDRSRLPDWEPEDEPEVEPEPRPKKKSAALLKRKKAEGEQSKSAKKDAPVARPKRRAISDFETWTDNDNVEVPREITINRTHEPAPIVDELYDEDTGSLDNDDDDSEFELLTSLEDAEAPEAWDPETVSVADEDNEPQDSSATHSPAELPQSTALENDYTTDAQSPIDETAFDAPYLAEDRENVVSTSAPETPHLEDEMTDVDINELPEAPKKSHHELIQEHSDAPLDLSRAISLDALDQIVFPTDSEGYNKANVDAMMGFLRLSLSLYIRQADRLEKTIEGLANELEERNELYSRARTKIEASVSAARLHDAEADRDHLASVVRDLASQLGVDANELIGGNDPTDDVLVFNPVSSTPQNLASTSAEDDEVTEVSTPDSSPESADEEILTWGALK